MPTPQQTADQMLILDRQRRNATRRGQRTIASIISKDMDRLALNLFFTP